MLAYVFWHWPRPDVARDAYEALQRGFHAALAAAPSDGFARSHTHAVAGAPWANGGAAAYEDWYLLRDSAALDPLNDAAVSASRQAAHDAAAAGAAGGTAGLYTLRLGHAGEAPACARWFAKPAGVSYAQLDERLAPVVDRSRGALWMRRMTLGPAFEFCLLTGEPVELPPGIESLALRLRSVWPATPAPGARSPSPSRG